MRIPQIVWLVGAVYPVGSLTAPSTSDINPIEQARLEVRMATAHTEDPVYSSTIILQYCVVAKSFSVEHVEHTQ